MLKKYFTRSLRSLVKYFSTLEEKFRISEWPCNILYIFINNLTNNISSGNIVTDTTDHFSQVCIVNVNKQKLPHTKKTKRRDYSSFNANKFINDLSAINKHAPLRDASVRKLKMWTKPRLTAGLRKSIKVKNKLFFESNWPKYKIDRNKLTTLIRLSKQRHYQRFFDSNIKNPRSTWKGIKEILGDAKKRKKSKRINFIRSNGHSDW